jgi:hypothetical protein
MYVLVFIEITGDSPMRQILLADGSGLKSDGFPQKAVAINAKMERVPSLHSLDGSGAVGSMGREPLKLLIHDAARNGPPATAALAHSCGSPGVGQRRRRRCDGQSGGDQTTEDEMPLRQPICPM